ncbi:MAG TPA: AAA family ATPase [Gaiellaceae bacterium]|nr:AAA family ATPase [Gaiellaceae bacterium]
MSPSAAKPRLVELAGPAGAGKSTVFRALVARDGTVEGRPSLRKREYAGVLASELLGVARTLLRDRAYLSRVTPEQIQMMAYLQALPRVLDRVDLAESRTLALDQGPIYLLTRRSLTNERLAAWRRRVVQTWAPLLDVVVWLDAPDAVLVERINARDKRHRLQGSPEETALKALRESRAVYERVLDELETDRPRWVVLRFDTSVRSAEEIADEVLAALDERETPVAQSA